MDYGHAHTLGDADEIAVLTAPRRVHMHWAADGVSCGKDARGAAPPSGLAADKGRRRLEAHGLWEVPAIPLVVGARGVHPRLHWAFDVEKNEGQAEDVRVGTIMMRVAMMLVSAHDDDDRWTSDERRRGLCVVRAHARLLLGVGYSTAVEVDEAELEAEDAGTRLHTALAVRIAEKRLVGALIANLSSALAKQTQRAKARRGARDRARPEALSRRNGVRRPKDELR